MSFGELQTGPSLQQADPPDPNDLVKAGDRSVPKSWLIDPYSMIDHLGLGYRVNPSNVTYETLKNMGEREPIEKGKHREFFDLAERFRAAANPEDVRRLGDQMGRMVFGD